MAAPALLGARMEHCHSYVSCTACPQSARAKLPASVLEAQKRIAAARKERERREKAEAEALEEGEEEGGLQELDAEDAEEAYANRFKIITNPPRKQRPIKGKTK